MDLKQYFNDSFVKVTSQEELEKLCLILQANDLKVSFDFYKNNFDFSNSVTNLYLYRFNTDISRHSCKDVQTLHGAGLKEKSKEEILKY